MRFGIGAKLGVLASVLIIGTSTIVAWWLNRWSRDSLRRESQAHLAGQALLRGEELLSGLDAVRRETQQLAARAELQELLRAPAFQQPALKQSAEDALNQSLKRLPHLLQAEFLPARPAELPTLLVRRSTSEGRVSVRNEDRLQRYFPGGFEDRQAAGLVRLSGIESNGDGTIGGKPVPVFRAALPLFVSGAGGFRFAGCAEAAPRLTGSRESGTNKEEWQWPKTKHAL